ncbi:MAG TPA: DNA internalization-related competence protein ComEC/Rec2 [Pseudoduganella sp.]
MRVAILGFIAGAAWLHQQPVLPARPWLVLSLVAIASLLLLAVLLRTSTREEAPVDADTANWRMRWWRGLALGALKAACVAALAGMLGYYWAAALAQGALEPSLAKEDEGRDFIVTGTIDNLPYVFDGGARFNFAVERTEGAGAATVPPRIAISWYANLRGEPVAVPEILPGERWRLKVRLQRPHGNANPYGFDYELWLLEQGVRATGYVRSEGPNQRLDSFVPTPMYAVERSRSVLRAKIQRALEGRTYAGVIVALAIGDQRGIPQSDWQIFNRTGISHLISISGLHITMVAGLVALLATWLWRHSFFVQGAALPLILPAQKLGAVVGMCAALAYVALAGFGIPAQRTLYMLSVIAVALWLDRLTNVSHVLLLAAGVTVLLDPWAVMWPGFWLSFGAVATILYASLGRPERHSSRRPSTQDMPAGPHASRAMPMTRRDRMLRGLRAAAVTQYAVTVGLVPLTMLLFAQISVISPVANAFAIPLVSLLVTPLALAGSVLPEPIGTPLLLVAHELVRALAAALTWCSARPFAIWSAPTPEPWMFAWALVGTAWTLAPRGWPVRWLGLATCVPLLMAQPSHPPPGELRVTAFDVGQGMALLVETSGHRLLYDTGPYYSPGSNGGNRVIVPYLRARGIHRLDGMIVTHSDADHSGGALAILESVRTGWVLSSLAEGHPIAKAAPVHRHCEAGQKWEWDGVRFEMLHPTAESYANHTLKPNARGCTLMIRAGAHAILLPADIEAAQEAELVARDGGALRANVLLVPHHGSGTSSTPAFLQAVQPQTAIFQLGYRNRYHHPRADVVERYRRLGASLDRTDESGAILLQLGQNDIAVTKYRTEHARYWYGR